MVITRSSTPTARTCTALLAVSMLVLLCLFASRIDRHPFAADGMENMKAVYNLLARSTFSTEPYYVYYFNPRYDDAAVLPNMYREPLPIAVAAAAIAALDDQDLSRMPFERFNRHGSGFVRLVKMLNCAWLVLGFVLVYYAVVLFTGNHYLALPAAVVPPVYILLSGSLAESINWFMTDVQGATLVLASSLLLVHAVQRQRARAFAIAGAALGLTALTKSVVLFAYPLVLLLLGIYVAAARTGRRGLVGLAVISAALLAVVGPWMLRNYLRFDSLGIASRGGVALYARAVQNDIADGKLHAALYWYSPSALRPAMGRLVGVRDEDFFPDGPYAKVNRTLRVGIDDPRIWAGETASTESYFGHIFAEYRRRLLRLDERGDEPYPVQVVDAELYEEAKAKIFGNIGAHLAAAPLFAYRGLWNGMFPALPILVVWILFGIWVGRSLIANDLPGLAFVIVPAALFATFALGTLFIDRYSLILMLNAYVAALVMGYRLFRLLPIATRTRAIAGDGRRAEEPRAEC